MEYQLVLQNDINTNDVVVNDVTNTLNMYGICLELLNNNNNDDNNNSNSNSNSNSNIVVLKCGHKLHNKCYEELIKVTNHSSAIKRCPYCKT